MATRDSFPYLIDYVLGELELASEIRIDCKKVEENSIPAIFASIRVVAINGMDSSCLYLQQLRQLKDQALCRFREVIPLIALADIDAFIDLALRRVRQITRSVIVVEFKGQMIGIGNDASFSIEQIQCFLEDDLSYDSLVYAEAMYQTRRQAWIYYLVLKRLSERIRCFTGGTIVMPVMSPVKLQANPDKKIRVNATVAFVGAFLRVACDRGLIEVSNVSELCRWASENFCTQRQENLSPHSIRNHFDNPAPEPLKEVMQEIEIWDKYLAKFIQQQQS